MCSECLSFFCAEEEEYECTVNVTFCSDYVKPTCSTCSPKLDCRVCCVLPCKTCRKEKFCNTCEKTVCHKCYETCKHSAINKDALNVLVLNAVETKCVGRVTVWIVLDQWPIVMFHIVNMVIHIVLSVALLNAVQLEWCMSKLPKYDWNKPTNCQTAPERTS